MTQAETRLLHHLARHYNVQTSYYDVFGRLKHSSPDGLMGVLRVLGAPVEKMADVGNALRERRQSLWQSGIDPVLIAWDGGPLKFKLRLPQALAEQTVRYQVQLEDGGFLEGKCHNESALKAKGEEVEGARYVARWLTLPERVPLGYHRVKLQVRDLSLESHLVSCPVQAHTPPEGPFRTWGVFSPLYGLRSERSWGAGNFSDLRALVEWVENLGGQVVGTLPLLAAFLGDPYDPSPYSPVSRLFWNEFYLDVTQVPELERCPAAGELIHSSEFQSELESLRSAPLVDYRRLMGLKRKVIEKLARSLLSEASQRQLLFRRFVDTHPIAEDYAAFRAKIEFEHKPWGQWAETSRNGVIRPREYDGAVKQYHLYVQWLAHEQMHALGEKAKAGGPALYLDFPLGVHRDGYDVWRERRAFALDASGGAPPDGFFTKGQNWGFPPFHPEGIRAQGYRYYIRCLRHHLQYSRMLRIDHIMGLHRLFWIPQGLEPEHGVYVRYPAEEFYSILNLESHRHRASIVGENLGTVHPSVNQALARHKIFGMYVGQFGVTPDPEKALEEVPTGTVASLNTHDTPTFAGFWSGIDIDDRVDLGLLSQEQSGAERDSRTRQKEALIRFLQNRGWLQGESPDEAAVLKAWLCHLSSGAAELVLINLEDLWLEPNPQNVPGTWDERPNWKRKASYSIEQLCQMESVVDVLKTVTEVRQRRR